MIILVLSDLHIPCHHPHAFDFLADLNRRFRPEHVVCIGDEMDGHAWSRFAKSPNAPGGRDELHQTKRHLRTLFQIFPRVRVCHSNHTVRPYKRAAEIGIPADFLRSIPEVLEAPPGWSWHSHVRLDGIRFSHGEGYSGAHAAAKAAQNAGGNAVIGHIHNHAGIRYLATDDGMIWGMNVGCLLDPDSFAAEYNRTNPVQAVLGTGVVCDGIPHFIPLLPPRTPRKTEEPAAIAADF